jgi:hypothetical protein
MQAEMARVWVLLLCSVASGCGHEEVRPEPITLEKMPRPVFVEARGGATCGGTAAVDGSGAIWVAGGCGGGPLPFKGAGKLEGVRLEAFRAALERVRQTAGPDGGAPCVEGFRSIALYETAAGPPLVWTFCVGKGERVPDALDILVAR